VSEDNNDKIIHGGHEDQRFVDELRTSYLLYSLSVIVSRAIPDARDGLKPVQRRILYSMNELGLRHTASYKKSARIVGEVMGKYHPHGDSSIYDALVRMAQPFSMRYMLVNGQGNFGSIDKDPAAAMRYTEARMFEESEFMLKDIDKNTVDYIDNFDGSLKEPVVLPTRMPALLMNGASGIAVGMATSIPPHNLTELVDGIKHVIDNPEAEAEELMDFIKGPDFPTGGIIVDGENIEEMYKTGRGKVTIRSKYEIVEDNNGSSIVVSEIPYAVSKVDIIDQIVAYAVRKKENKKDSGIKDVRDETDKRGMRLVIELKRNANIKRLINDLLKHTSLQSSFSVQMNVINKGKPSLMNLKGLIQAFIEHRVDVITKRTEYELQKAKRRAHIVEGLIKAVDGIDTVIEIIRNSDGVEDALTNLQATIDVTEEQAKAISEMRLISLSKLETNKLASELKQLTEKISYCNTILQNQNVLNDIIKEELDEIKTKFGDERRTKILKYKSDLKKYEELIEDEDIIIVLTKWGYIKAIQSSQYKAQGRGGKGVKGLKISDNDSVLEILYTNRLSKLMIITSAGKAYQLPAYEIDMSQKTTKGKHIANYLGLTEDESIKAITTVSLKGDYEKDIMIFTKNGKVKKTSLAEFANARTKGIRAINLRDDDMVVDALVLNSSEDDVLLVTRNGMSLRFNSKDVRNMGRGASGVNSIKLRKNDEVVNAVLVEHDKKLMIITSKGYGKRTKFSSYRRQNRAGVGIKTVRDITKIGTIVSALSIHDGSDILIFTKNGKAIRTTIDNISVLNRVTQGVITVRLSPDDEVVGMIVVKVDEDDENN
jgi:DNA gyrase subunit A